MIPDHSRLYKSHSRYINSSREIWIYIPAFYMEDFMKNELIKTENKTKSIVAKVTGFGTEQNI